MNNDKLAILSFIEWMQEKGYITSLVFGVLRAGADRYMEERNETWR